MSRPPVPAPLDSSLARDLRRRLGAAAVLTDPDRLLVYESDGLPHWRRTPSAVVLPADTEEAAWAVGRLHQAGIPVVPRGAGTGLSGGALAGSGSVVLGTARMRRILELDPAGRRARVEAGVVNADLSRAARPHGLHYAPDPSSWTTCTLGGNVAENSGGPHCLKYGVTSRYVTGLTVVAAGGEVVLLGGGGSPPAPDLVGLFVGSEGCFGLATEIEVRLVARADGVRTLLAAFPTLGQAGGAVSAIIASGLVPAALEILDRSTIRAVEDSIFAAGYPRDAGAVLVAEFDGFDGSLDREVDRTEAICRDAGAQEVERAREEAERARLWKGRKKAFGAMGRLAPDMVVQDATVPRSRLPEVLERIDAIAARHGVQVANVFHAGDGNLHPNFVLDRRDPDQVARVDAASRETLEVCVEAGGTITGEHGVGLDKRRYMTLVHGPDELDAQRRVRAVFDPTGLWNPGKVLPDETPGAAPAEWHASARPGLRPGGRPSVAELRSSPDVEVESTGSGDPLVRPATEAALAAFMTRAAENGWRIGLGGSSGHDGRVQIDTGRLAGVLEYEPADLTLVAGAGTPLAAVATRTRDAHQWLPVDAPDLATGTVGGLVARGTAGALAASHGAVRDLVLGLTLVTGTGRVLRLGGRVVKNVAGFDLVRLVVGSRGALGVITRATLRLVPVPEADRTWLLRAGAPEDLVVPALAAAACRLPPAAVELGWSSAGAELAVRAVGAVATVEETGRLLARDLAGGEVLQGDDAAGARAALRGPLQESGARVRLAGGAGDLHGLVSRVRLRAEEAGAPSCGWLLADRGVAWVGLPDGAAPDGFAGAPTGRAALWGRELKRAFDPEGILPNGPFPAEDR